jgi:hypothetical protein
LNWFCKDVSAFSETQGWEAAAHCGWAKRPGDTGAPWCTNILRSSCYVENQGGLPCDGTLGAGRKFNWRLHGCRVARLHGCRLPEARWKRPSRCLVECALLSHLPFILFILFILFMSPHFSHVSPRSLMLDNDDNAPRTWRWMLKWPRTLATQLVHQLFGSQLSLQGHGCGSAADGPLRPRNWIQDVHAGTGRRSSTVPAGINGLSWLNYIMTITSQGRGKTELGWDHWSFKCG